MAELILSFVYTRLMEPKPKGVFMNFLKLAMTPFLAYGLSFSVHAANVEASGPELDQNLDFESMISENVEMDQLSFVTAGAKKQQRKFQGKKKSKACKDVNLTDEQKAQIKTKLTEFKEQAKTLKEDLKKAKTAYHEVLIGEESTLEDASASSGQVVEKSSALKSAHLGLKNSIFFEVATAAQRGPLLKCLKSKKQGHRHHGRRHGRRHGRY